jgi:hypothetical protein
MLQMKILKKVSQLVDRVKALVLGLKKSLN